MEFTGLMAATILPHLKMYDASSNQTSHVTLCHWYSSACRSLGAQGIFQYWWQETDTVLGIKFVLYEY